MKVTILLKIILVALGEFKFELLVPPSDSLYYVNTLVGSSKTSIKAAIDLSGQNLILSCYYSHSEKNDTYLPTLSNSSKYQDKIDNCRFRTFDKGNINELCEMTLEIMPGQKVIVNEFKDSIVLGEELFESSFLCIENIEKYNMNRKNAVLGLGPNSQTLSFICKNRYLPERFYFYFGPGKGEMWIGVRWINPKASITLNKQTNNYSFKIDSIEFSTKQNTTALFSNSDFSLDSNSRYSFLTTQNYFSLTRKLKSIIHPQVASTKYKSRDCYTVPQTKDLESFPDLVLDFKNTTKLFWKPLEYLEKTNDTFYCLGILPSFTNTLGMNFLQGKRILIDLRVSSIEFLEKSPEEIVDLKGPAESSSTLIIAICISVILLQIAAGYYFLKKNRSPAQLQTPNIPVSQLDISY